MATRKSTSKPAVKETPKEESQPAARPILTVDELIQRASGQCYLAEHLKHAASHLEELAMMLYEAQDRGTSLSANNPDIKYLSDTAQGIQILMSALADDVEHMAGYIEDLSKDAFALKKQREKAGAE
jgi:hypothetical protein